MHASFARARVDGAPGVPTLSGVPGFDYRHATWDEVCGLDLVPHPELVKAQKPSAGLFMAAALCLGVFPDPTASYLAGEERIPLGV